MAQKETQNKENHPIEEGVNNYLSMNTSGALLVTGDWGCGKTYYFKKELFNKITEKGSSIPIIVSLFGLTELKEIPERVLYAYLDEVGENKAAYGKIAKFTKNMTEALPFIKKYIDINKLFGSGEGLYKIIPKNILICFDDIERAISKIEINDILGVINELVENKEYKVIIIANESFIKTEELLFKEKVIEKTLIFSPDIVAIFTLLVRGHDNSLFIDFMLHEFIISSINPQDKSTRRFMNSGLQNNLSNIRIIKFAIEHFYPVFFHYTAEAKLIDKTTEKKLRSYWIFILSVSIEYKINNLSYLNNRNLDRYEKTANFDIDLGDDFFAFEEDDDEEEEQRTKEQSKKDQKYTHQFFDRYFSRLLETPIFYIELYNYITAGIAINYHNLDDYTNQKFSIYDNVINPAHELLRQFLEAYWIFTNEEFPTKLHKLLDYAQESHFNNYMDYINTTSCLMRFQDISGQSKKDIIDKVKIGIDEFTERVEISFTTKTNIQMAHEYLKKDVIPIYDYVLESIDRKLENNFKKESDDIRNLFKTDMEQLVSKIIPQDNNTTPQYFNIPILKNIDTETIKSTIINIEPNDAMCLNTIIKQRYTKDLLTKNIKEELLFLNYLKENIDAIDVVSKTLTSFIIKEFLYPNLTKAIHNLELI